MPSNAIAVPSFQSWWAGYLKFAADLLGTFRASEQAADRTDEDLVRAMHRGDDRSFDLLYEKYFNRIYAFVVRRVGSHQVAEDLVADVFMKAFTNRKAFVWRGSFTAWIYRIATNRVTDYHRTKKHAEPFDEAVHDRPSTVPNAPELVDRELLRRRLDAVLDVLSERERIAVTMKYYGECDNGEIATALHVTPNNVGVILHRALKKCQAHYE